VVTAAIVVLLAACGNGPAHRQPPVATVGTSAQRVPSSQLSPALPAASSTPTTSHPPARPPSSSRSASSAQPSAAQHAGTAPVIVIDPGHSKPIHAIDPATGLDVSDYENEPEMRDVYAVAELVRAQLLAAGYRVIMTKPTVDTPVSLGQRSAIANAADAALALSIHDQAGSNGGIGFADGNNIVYYQAVGDYRETPQGRKVVFTDAAVAAVSRRYAQIFQDKRAQVQDTTVRLLGNTGYDLGSRGLPAGDIWLVQLLARVPWIYNEAGGNSRGMTGLNPTDQQRYADGLVAAVEACVPV
jgi:N-acetylmuramoyl-L-alanine amidase